MAELLAGILIGLVLAYFLPKRNKRKTRKVKTQPQIYNPVSSKKVTVVSKKRKPIIQTEFKEIEHEQGLR